jgi:hypothetical protein
MVVTTNGSSRPRGGSVSAASAFERNRIEGINKKKKGMKPTQKQKGQ